MTNASNVGIDKHLIVLQVQFEWPRNLLTYFQERGRGSWTQGVRSTCVLFGNFLSYIYLMSKLLVASQVDNDAAQGSNEVEGFNSATLPRKHGRSQQQNKKTKFMLGPTARRSLT
jgi:hypothetical protein